MSEKNTEIVHVARCLADIDKRVKKYDARAEKAGAEMVLIAKCLADANTRLKQIESSPKVEYATPLQLKRVELRLDSLARNLADANEKTTAKELAKIADGAKKLESDIAKLLAQNERLDAKLLEQGKGFNPRGKYETGEKYARFDLVSSNGSSFIALVDNPTEPPTKRSKQWMLIASRGGSGVGSIGVADVIGLGTAATRDVGQNAGNVLGVAALNTIQFGDGTTNARLSLTPFDGSSAPIDAIDGGLTVSGSFGLKFGGFTSTFSPYSLNGNYTLTPPNASGTLALTSDLTALQSKAEVKSGNFTAVNDGVYTLVANGTATDPSPVEGKGFVVFVRNGTATVGGTAYATAGTVIRRVFHSGSWANYVYSTGGGGSVAVNDITGLGTGVATSLALNAGAAGGFVRTTDTATTSAAGVVQLSTDAQARAFTSTTTPITPAQSFISALNMMRIDLNLAHPSTSTANGGSGTSTFATFDGSISTGGGTTSYARRSLINRILLSGDGGAVNFDKPIGFQLLLEVRQITTNGFFRFTMTGGTIDTDAVATVARPTQKALGIYILNGVVYGVVHDGTTRTETSLGLSVNVLNASPFGRGNSITCIRTGSGSYEFFVNGVSGGTITGGPTGLSSTQWSADYLGWHFAVSSGGDSGTTQYFARQAYILAAQ
jgi:hypothetical protein